MHESSSPSIAESHLFRVIRNIFIVHSALLLIISSSLVGYGSWILVWATDLKIFDVILNYYYFSYAPPLMVACGLLCFILVAVGCCAACVEDVHLLLSVHVHVRVFELSRPSYSISLAAPFCSLWVSAPC
ncbi:hypothetical protein AAHC03_05007 [Spirometra sp. Aus1]